MGPLKQLLKTALKTIISLLKDYNDDEFYTNLIADLTELETHFKKVEFNYTYIEPTHDVANHQTTIRSKSSVKMEGDVLSNIISKIKNIRNGLIG